MIIIEGMDNSGKTTLANQLAADFGYEVIHSPGPLDRGAKMVQWLFGEIVAQRRNVIYDRVSMISDMVYSNIIRGEDSFYTKRGYIGAFKELLAATPHLIIFCMPSERAIKNYGEREQMGGVIDNTDELIEGYKRTLVEYSYDSRFTTLIYNYELGPKHYHFLVKDIKKYLANGGF